MQMPQIGARPSGSINPQEQMVFSNLTTRYGRMLKRRERRAPVKHMNLFAFLAFFCGNSTR